MAVRIPFVRSTSNQRLGVPLDGTHYLIDQRWNSRDEAWYMDLRQEDETPILLGIKLVLGATLGRQSTADFFKQYSLRVVDTLGTGVDAGFDDLGDRIQVVITSVTDTSPEL